MTVYTFPIVELLGGEPEVSRKLLERERLLAEKEKRDPRWTTRDAFRRWHERGSISSDGKSSLMALAEDEGKSYTADAFKARPLNHSNGQSRGAG